MKELKIKIEEIEEEAIDAVLKQLKKELGVLHAKIDQKTRIATIVFNKNRTSESNLKNIIERESGCWTTNINDNEKKFSTQSSRENSSIKFPLSLGIFSIILNIALIFIIYRIAPYAASGTQSSGNGAENPTAQNQAIQQFNITGFDHIRGNTDAPITLVEFSDFECPYCAKHKPTLDKILNDYKDKVRLVYKHFPLSFHPNSQKAAKASECADEQGKFWEYHDILFANQSNGFSVDNFKKWAKEINLTESKFNDCLDSGKYAEKVGADAKEGEQKGVDGTPATFVNGQLVSGAVPYDDLKKVIDNIK